MIEVKCNNCESINQNTSKYCSVCGYKLPVIEDDFQNNTSSKIKLDKPIEKQNSKSIKTVLFFVISFFVMFYVAQSLFKKPSIDVVMMEVASELNRACPIMVDKDTRFDNAISLPKKVFQYNYTLINLEKTTVDVEEIREFLLPNIINTIKTNPDMKFTRDNDLIVKYYYKDKNGDYLLTVTVNPEDYK
jgi:hypothetical protein